MRRHTSHILLPFVILMACASSCLVKEHRDICPCWLGFVLDGCASVADSLEICGWRDVTLFSEKVMTGGMSRYYEKEVDRGSVRTCVFAGISRYERDGYRLSLPEGQQADRLFLHTNTVMCDGEFATDTVVLHKQWANVTVRLNEGSAGARTTDGTDYRLIVRSDISGLDMLDQSPVRGTFRFAPVTDPDGLYRFRIPRHSGMSEKLVLDIYKDQVLVDEMPLGRTMVANGYDWSEESLADVEMDIYMKTGEVLITVVPWYNNGHEDLEF